MSARPISWAAIQPGIPIPARTKGRPLTEAGIKARQMKPGDSILCATPQQAAKLRDALNHMGVRVASRETHEGFRVWRLT